MPEHHCDAGDFSRMVCPEPCGTMHSYCSTCGSLQDECPNVGLALIPPQRCAPSEDEIAAWRREAVAAIDAVADRAWHEGYVAACEHYACDTVFDETPISPYESGGDHG